MIYLITGVPGSGKTLYAVADLLQKLAREKVKTEDGQELSRRLVIDNIPKLLIPHELMAPGTLKAGQIEPGEGHGLWNWHEWCKPGDVIVSDEVQRHWRPRGMGTKPPEAIAMLETHRHKGVDLVLITQNPMLLDQNVRRLVGRHLHVRRLFGGGRALIYEWDGCNTDTSRLSTGQRSYWSYPRSAFKLYASSELHTKQRQKIPVFMAFPLVVVALGAFAGPKAYDAMHRSMTGRSVASSPPASQPKRAEAAKPVQAAPLPVQASMPQPAPLAVASAAPALDVVGCVKLRERCECFGGDGRRVEVEPQACEVGSYRVGGLVPLGGGMGARPHVDASSRLVPNASGNDGSPRQSSASEAQAGPAAAHPPASAPVASVRAVGA